MKRVAITGVGAITPAGLGLSFLPSPEGFKDWGNHMLPDLNPADYGWKGLTRLSRMSQYGCMAIGEALKHAGWAVPPAKTSERSDTGMIIGTNYSNLEPILSMRDEADRYGVTGVNPALFPETVMNAIGGHASIYYQITGANMTISDGPLSGPKCLVYAIDLLDRGALDYVVCCMISIEPPKAFAGVVPREARGSESVVALLLRRDTEASATGSDILLEWNEPNDAYDPSDSLVLSSDALLGIASSYKRIASAKQPSQQLVISGEQEGYHRVRLYNRSHSCSGPDGTL